MKLNKQQITAIAKKIRQPLVEKNETLIQANNDALEAFVKDHPMFAEQKEINSKLIKIIRHSDSYVEHYVTVFLRGSFKYPNEVKPIPSEYDIENEIVIATIDAKDLDTLIASVSKKFA